MKELQILNCGGVAGARMAILRRFFLDVALPDGESAQSNLSGVREESFGPGMVSMSVSQWLAKALRQNWSAASCLLNRTRSKTSEAPCDAAF